MTLNQLIDELPKAELHLHLEGTLEPEHLVALAKKNKVKIPYDSVDDVRKAYQFGNLQEFLDVYYTGMSVLCTSEDFYELTKAYLLRAAADKVVHVEVFFDPQGHTHRGIPFDDVVSGISKALDEGRRVLGISSKLIMCFLRHLSEEDAISTLRTAEPFIDRISGVGLDSSELGYPPVNFAKVFELAGDMGLHRVAHAGEEGPPEYVEQALDVLHVDRIDHGNRALESLPLVQRLADLKMGLTVCPLSNLKLCVVDSMEQHPISIMLENGLVVSVNSDDPSYFGGYVSDNYKAVVDALNLTTEQVVQLVKNSFESSFLSEPEKEKHLSRIDEIVGKHST